MEVSMGLDWKKTTCFTLMLYRLTELKFEEKKSKILRAITSTIAPILGLFLLILVQICQRKFKFLKKFRNFQPVVCIHVSSVV